MKIGGATNYKSKFDECIKQLEDISPHCRGLYFNFLDGVKHKKDLLLHFKMFVPEVHDDDDDNSRDRKFVKVAKYFLDTLETVETRLEKKLKIYIVYKLYLFLQENFDWVYKHERFYKNACNRLDHITNYEKIYKLKQFEKLFYPKKCRYCDKENVKNLKAQESDKLYYCSESCKSKYMYENIFCRKGWLIEDMRNEIKLYL